MKIVNRKARFEYQLFDRLEAGISLDGHEAKSVFLGRIDLGEALVKLSGAEAFLINANIPPYEQARVFGYEPKRTRRLLLHKKEALALATKIMQKKLLLIPVSCYNKGRRIKLELALARRKKGYEKKEVVKRRELGRKTELE